ncbi:MAG: FliI/YscN family ATPase [Ectothiorhodospiraceae bacterium]|nr:FliI/YscN family ATPase [Ectothiorhodospiraceae bacterium]
MNAGAKTPDYLASALDGALGDVSAIQARGRVLEAVGTLVKVTGIAARIGDVCEIRDPQGDSPVLGEVVGISRQAALLMPFGELEGVSAESEVLNLRRPQTVPVGDSLLGRILDGFGHPIDGGAPLGVRQGYPVRAPAPNPLTRRPVSQSLQTGVRAIDAVLTCGEGQRVGIFAPAGSGKSSLMTMIARGTSADVTVIALVGERGREVGEFIRNVMTPEQRERTVCIVATSDRPSVERAKAPNVATAVAEYFRDQGLSVLLLMDSVTRYARALREIGLAAGEPPTRRGFPPSVFTALPRLFERAGQSDRGAITAFYTVLVDDDEGGDPVGEEMRAILDGHIVLSPKLVAATHFPAIDVMESRSRVMDGVVQPEHRRLAGELVQLIAKYRDVEMLVQIGEYQEGMDPLADRAIASREAIGTLLRQDTTEIATLNEAIECLRATLRQPQAG